VARLSIRQLAERFVLNVAILSQDGRVPHARALSNLLIAARHSRFLDATIVGGFSFFRLVEL
jgi:hypothetical protein